MQGIWETWVQSLGWEDPLEKTATHSSILAWEIPWTEGPGGLQSTGPESDMTGPSEHPFHCLHFNIIFLRSNHFIASLALVFPFLYHYNKIVCYLEAHEVLFPRGCVCVCVCMYVCMSVSSPVWLFVTPWTVCSLPSSLVHGISQARILELEAI